MIANILIFIIISLIMMIGIALVMILSQPPRRRLSGGRMEFGGQLAQDVAPLPVSHVTARDGAEMPVRGLGGPPGAPLVILLHGSAWYGAQFDGLAPQLARHADVLVPDLRGHGGFPGPRGDIAHMGQLEEDIADLIAARARPGQKVILAGHSSGGGLAIRFAGGEYRDMIDGAVLLAPYLHYRSATIRQDSGWAHVLLRRIIGLSILNLMRIHALDGLTVIQFAMPRAVLDGPRGDMATTAYSWRLNQSLAPRNDYGGDLSALPPFLLIAGEADEAFDAAEYQPAMVAATDKGRYLLLPGVGHLDVVNAPDTPQAIGEFLAGYSDQPQPE